MRTNAYTQTLNPRGICGNKCLFRNFIQNTLNSIDRNQVVFMKDSPGYVRESPKIVQLYLNRHKHHVPKGQ